MSAFVSVWSFVCSFFSSTPHDQRRMTDASVPPAPRRPPRPPAPAAAPGAGRGIVRRTVLWYESPVA